MTRTEHIKWAKQRALAYVDAGDYNNAVSSMLSDLSKHEETRNLGNAFIGMAGALEIRRGPDAVRHWINGFTE